MDARISRPTCGGPGTTACIRTMIYDRRMNQILKRAVLVSFKRNPCQTVQTAHRATIEKARSHAQIHRIHHPGD